MIARGRIGSGGRVFSYLVEDTRWSFFFGRVNGHDCDGIGDNDADEEMIIVSLDVRTLRDAVAVMASCVSQAIRLRSREGFW